MKRSNTHFFASTCGIKTERGKGRIRIIALKDIQNSVDNKEEKQNYIYSEKDIREFNKEYKPITFNK